MTFWAFPRYSCDDGATVSCAKLSQALPPIFFQSCETKSGTESLGSRLDRYSLPFVTKAGGDWVDLSYVDMHQDISL